ncbi:MAG: hypothetical protein ACP6IP_07295 [Candidatus Njordarchaeia archaeon]
MEPHKYDNIEILLSETAKLLLDEKEDEAHKLLKKLVEDLEKIGTSENEIVPLTDLILRTMNLLPLFERDVVDILKMLKELIKSLLKPKSIELEYLYSRALAIYSDVAFKLGLNPTEELNEAEEILYKLAADHGYVKQYAAFINLYYAPITHRLGDTKKALKALEVATDELYFKYKQNDDKELLALLGELYITKAEILYDVGDYVNTVDMLEQAYDFFCNANDHYLDYKLAICLNLIDLYKKGNRINRLNDCKNLIHRVIPLVKDHEEREKLEKLLKEL